MRESYKRKLIAAFEAVDSLVVNDDELDLEDDAELGEAVARLHTVLVERLEVGPRD